MRSYRLSRLLLRLYPRAWRARYGDEFLAFVADTPLSGRAAIDVVGAAIVERGRSLAALVREQRREAHDPSLATLTLRDRAAETVSRFSFITLAVWIGHLLGVPYPTASSTWTLLVNLWILSTSPIFSRGQAWFERSVLASAYFAAGMVGALVSFAAVTIAHGLGIPSPSERLAATLLLVWLVAGVGRLGYASLRWAVYRSRWRGMHPAEPWCWKAGLLLCMLVLLMSGDELAGSFWSMTIVFCYFLSPMPTRWFSREAIARRRAELEAAEARWRQESS